MSDVNVFPLWKATQSAQTAPYMFVTFDAYIRPFGTNKVAETICGLKNWTAVVAPALPMELSHTVKRLGGTGTGVLSVSLGSTANRALLLTCRLLWAAFPIRSSTLPT